MGSRILYNFNALRVVSAKTRSGIKCCVPTVLKSFFGLAAKHVMVRNAAKDSTTDLEQMCMILKLLSHIKNGNIAEYLLNNIWNK